MLYEAYAAQLLASRPSAEEHDGRGYVLPFNAAKASKEQTDGAGEKIDDCCGLRGEMCDLHGAPWYTTSLPRSSQIGSDTEVAGEISPLSCCLRFVVCLSGAVPPPSKNRTRTKNHKHRQRMSSAAGTHGWMSNGDDYLHMLLHGTKGLHRNAFLAPSSNDNLLTIW
jgi:hypothetical protein